MNSPAPKDGQGPWQRREPNEPGSGGEGGPPKGGSPWRAVLIFLGGIALLLLIIRLISPEAWEAANTRALVGGIATMTTIGALIVMGWTAPIGQSLRMAGLWVAIIAVLALGYSFRGDLALLGGRIVGGFVPHRGAEQLDGGILYERGADGHFHITLDIGGQPVRFLVDTGATLTLIDQPTAERLGFLDDRLAFREIMRTANGMARVAIIRVDEIRLKNNAFRNVSVSVPEQEIGVNLLGMSFLDRLNGFEIRGDQLTLYP